MVDSPRTSQVGQLFDALRADDSDARERLIEFATARLKGMAHRMLRSNPVARWEQSDDLLQQTLIRLHRNLENSSCGDARSLLGFAAVEMRRALIDLARHYYGAMGLGANHATDQGGEAAKPPQRVSGASPLEHCLQVERWQILQGHIDELPADERETVDLLWLHQLSQIEVAAMLDVDTRTVRRRWLRARMRLFAALSESLDRSSATGVSHEAAVRCGWSVARRCPGRARRARHALPLRQLERAA